jgi:hypothetical protein
MDKLQWAERIVGHRLKLQLAVGRSLSGSCGLEPDSGNPTVRDHWGALGNTGYGGTRNPLPTAKAAELETLFLRCCAPSFYPDRVGLTLAVTIWLAVLVSPSHEVNTTRGSGWVCSDLRSFIKVWQVISLPIQYIVNSSGNASFVP